MFDWIKKLFYSKDFDGYSKNEKLENSNTSSASINKTTTPPTTPTTPQTTTPIIYGPKGQTGISGLPGLQGHTGFTGSSSYIGNGYQVCTEEGCYSFFKVNNKNEKRCPTCVQKNREKQIKKLLE
jgi:hypothetical protein